MKKESRIVCYDKDLGIEAYTLDGIVQPFPNHLHDFYVIGYMMSGQRYLSCKNKEYSLRGGDLVIFNPGDNHTCAQLGNEPLHYLGMNIPKPVMMNLAREIAGKIEAPYMSKTIIRDEEVTSYFQLLHENIMSNSGEFENEELFYFMISKLLHQYDEEENSGNDFVGEIKTICDYINEHYREVISLEDLRKLGNISKSTLLRFFTKKMGMTPYRYLQSVRIGMAKGKLESGVTLIEAALQSGFTDQSHFSKFFTMFIGLTPGAYREIFMKDKRKENRNESTNESTNESSNAEKKDSTMESK